MVKHAIRCHSDLVKVDILSFGRRERICAPVYVGNSANR